MKAFNVTGMTCAACSSRVEKAVSKVEGVTQVSVNLLLNSMQVEGNADASAIIRAVKEAGYGASEKNAGDVGNKGANQEGLIKQNTAMDQEAVISSEYQSMKIRLISSLVLLLPLMYVSMGHMMWDFPLPESFSNNHVAMGLYQLLLTAMIMVINQRFFMSGFRSLFKGAPNMDSLVAIGSMASFGYSVFALFAMSEAAYLQNHER